MASTYHSIWANAVKNEYDVERIHDALRNVDGIASVQITPNFSTGVASIVVGTGDAMTDDELIGMIGDAGFHAAPF